MQLGESKIKFPSCLNLNLVEQVWVAGMVDSCVHIRIAMDSSHYEKPPFKLKKLWGRT
jgi:hypothetical protein